MLPSARRSISKPSSSSFTSQSRARTQFRGRATPSTVNRQRIVTRSANPSPAAAAGASVPAPSASSSSSPAFVTGQKRPREANAYSYARGTGQFESVPVPPAVSAALAPRVVLPTVGRKRKRGVFEKGLRVRAEFVPKRTSQGMMVANPPPPGGGVRGVHSPHHPPVAVPAAAALASKMTQTSRIKKKKVSMADPEVATGVRLHGWRVIWTLGDEIRVDPRVAKIVLSE